ncbi:MAG: tripartite tricarboxylate transporter substrate binding protein [Alphaproteobacteria bacterium]|nr:tripartite tricarboxylate transporter substrate binding protein [Alphaproteobacteria bacterium]
MRGLAAAVVTLVSLFMAAPAAQADDAYPSKPVHILVPYPAGGGTDALARTFGKQLTISLGQPVVIENRPGSGTLLAADIVAHAAPDGYALLWATCTTLGISPSMYKTPAINPLTDFTPIAQVARATFLLVTAKTIPVKTVADLVAYAKAHPGKLNYGSAGSGTPHHLYMEMLKQKTGIDVVHVPYKGSGPATLDLLSGQLAMMVDDVTPLNGHVENGDVHLIAVAGDKPSPLFPGVPAVGESVPGFDLRVWQGIVGPARTPGAVVIRLNAAIVKIVQAPDYPKELVPFGMEPLYRAPDEFKAYLVGDVPRWAELVKEAGAHVE